MEIKTTRIYEENAEAWLSGKRRALNEGGTASSKTWSILQLLILIAEHTKSPLLISVVSESLPHLKRGAIRDFFRILDESPDNNPRYNKTEQKYTFGKGVIEFFGADESDKVRGPRRDILFINEGNNVPWETARGLDIRTAKFTFVDWNPISEFWAHENWINHPENAYIHSTYQDALDVLPPEVVANIESNRDKDPNWWNIYGLGLIGKIEGLVYPFFSQVDNLPPQGELVYGLDFGFSGDPAVLTKNKIFSESLYSQELFYERGLTNQDIAQRMLDLGIQKNSDIIWADSAEPKSIEEIYQYGFNIKGAPKGPGSVEYGHQKVRQYKQCWTKDSVNCIKEQRNFRYIADKNNKLTEKTTHIYSHGMDSRRYAVMGLSEPPEPEETVVVYDAMEQVKDLELR
jgi:phage terminase large subunit